jgi:hypothetical protein
MVNNFNIIRPLLDWGGELDFYTVGLILRKKDQTTTYGNKNNSARIIKMYYFFEQNQFDEKEVEIKALCEEFGCRAGIYLNRRNLKDMAYDMQIMLAQAIHDGSYRRILGLFDTVVGTKQSTDKIKFLDCDSQQEYNVIKRLLQDPGLRPYDTDKIIAEIPTNSGMHVVVKRFDVDYFKKLIAAEPDFIFDYDHSEQCVNPTALYYPIKNDIDKAAREAEVIL